MLSRLTLCKMENRMFFTFSRIGTFIFYDNSCIPVSFKELGLTLPLYQYETRRFHFRANRRNQR